MSEETKNQSEEVNTDSPETNDNEQVRTPRSVESREIDSRPMSWDAIGNLPEPDPQDGWVFRWVRSEEHTSELQSQSTISYAVFCLKKKNKKKNKKK